MVGFRRAGASYGVQPSGKWLWARGVQPHSEQGRRTPRRWSGSGSFGPRGTTAQRARVAEKGGIVVSVLWNSDTTEEIVTQDFLARMAGGVHIGMCTGSPQAAQRLAKLHEENGSAYVEAPVFGRPEAALARQLAIPYIGSRGAKERVKPILTALGGAALFDMGEQAGLATMLKQLGNFPY